MAWRLWTAEVVPGYTLLEWGLAMAVVLGLLLQPTLGPGTWRQRSSTWLRTMEVWLLHGRWAALAGGQPCRMTVVFHRLEQEWCAVMRCGDAPEQVRSTGLGPRWYVAWYGNRGLPGLRWLPNGQTAAQQGHWCIGQVGVRSAEVWYVSQGGQVRRAHDNQVCKGLGLSNDFAKLTGFSRREST